MKAKILKIFSSTSLVKHLLLSACIGTVLLASGCANTKFALTGDGPFEMSHMQHLVLRPTYPINVPTLERESFERKFKSSSRMPARVVAVHHARRVETDHYFLDAKFTKYKPGSVVSRSIVAPWAIFGLGGIYVNVDYSLYDPRLDCVIGSGVLRKEYLGGHSAENPVLIEDVMLEIPKEILKELSTYMAENDGSE